jgi:hypothetical protein
MLPLAGSNEPAPDRTGGIDHIQERGKSPNRELGGHELRVPKWAPIRRKTTEKSTNSGSGFDGIGGYFQGFRRGVENCKTFMRRFDPDPRLQISSTTYETTRIRWAPDWPTLREFPA